MKKNPVSDIKSPPTISSCIFTNTFFCLFGSTSVLPGHLMQELHREGKVANQVCGQSKDNTSK